MSGTTTTNLPLVMTSAGPQTTPVQTLWQTTISNAQTLAPGITNDLPGSLIEDMTSTSVGALSQMDQARVDAVNSVSPLAANPFILAMLGQQFGIPQGIGSNTSVSVVFTVTSNNQPVSGYVISAGAQVGDGSYTYITQAAVTTQSNGTTQQVAAIATQSGSWAVGAGTVTNVSTSFPSQYVVTVTNPNPGTAGTAAQTVAQYRSQILTAQQITVQGTGGAIQTALANIPGIQSRLILAPVVSGGFKVICGLTVDQNLIAGTIYQAVDNPALLQGSATSGRNVTTTITDGPNTYSIRFVNPPNQVVTGSVTWATNLPNFASGTQVNALATSGLVDYINSIQVGSPINELEMTAAFQNAVASVLPAPNIIALTFSIYINAVLTPVETGTSIIPGDSESYFSAAANAFTVTQG